MQDSQLFFNYTRNLEALLGLFRVEKYIRYGYGNLELISCKTNKENQAGDSRFITQ